nr:MAG TPA: hypothetical protein [Bacteriophage sp.]
MGWVKTSKWSKYFMYQHQGQAEILKIIPSYFSNNIPYRNPILISSTSNMIFLREGIFDNRVVKNNDNDFTLTKVTTDMGFQSQIFPLFYLIYNAIQGQANYKVNFNINSNQQIYMLRVYLTQSMSVFHTTVNSGNNKPPIELGFKIYNGGNNYMNIASRGQWDGFNAIPFYAGKYEQYNSEVITEVRHKVWEYKNLNIIPTQTITFEAYPVSLPQNFSITDQFLSFISCRVDIYTKGTHLVPQLNQIFIYES